MNFLRKIPWWLWIAALVAAFLLWQSLSGWAMSGKLYKMALDQLRADQTRIVETLEEQVNKYEQEIANLEAQIRDVRKAKAAADQRAAESANEAAKLKGENNALRERLKNMPVPDDPNKLIDGLRRRFPSLQVEP